MSPDTNKENHFANLKALSSRSFPKKCTVCGKQYETAELFIRETMPVRQGASGLKGAFDDSHGSIVELFRNCHCGSTLMDCFADRRDLSDKGMKRRRLFERILILLENKGMERHKAQVELLKLMRGEKSAVLEQMGIGCADIQPPK